MPSTAKTPGITKRTPITATATTETMLLTATAIIPVTIIRTPIIPGLSSDTAIGVTTTAIGITGTAIGTIGTADTTIGVPDIGTAAAVVWDMEAGEAVAVVGDMVEAGAAVEVMAAVTVVVTAATIDICRVTRMPICKWQLQRPLPPR